MGKKDSKRKKSEDKASELDSDSLNQMGIIPENVPFARNIGCANSQKSGKSKTDSK